LHRGLRRAGLQDLIGRLQDPLRRAFWNRICRIPTQAWIYPPWLALCPADEAPRSRAEATDSASHSRRLRGVPESSLLQAPRWSCDRGVHARVRERESCADAGFKGEIFATDRPRANPWDVAVREHRKLISPIFSTSRGLGAVPGRESWPARNRPAVRLPPGTKPVRTEDEPGKTRPPSGESFSWSFETLHGDGADRERSPSRPLADVPARAPRHFGYVAIGPGWMPALKAPETHASS